MPICYGAGCASSASIQRGFIAPSLQHSGNFKNLAVRARCMDIVL